MEIVQYVLVLEDYILPDSQQALINSFSTLPALRPTIFGMIHAEHPTMGEALTCALRIIRLICYLTFACLNASVVVLDASRGADRCFRNLLSSNPFFGVPRTRHM